MHTVRKEYHGSSEQAARANRIISRDAGVFTYAGLFCICLCAGCRSAAAAATTAPAAKTAATAAPQLSLGCRWTLLVTVIMLAAASLVVVSRFASIAEQYNQINQLKSDIQGAQLRIGALNVALECAVSIQDIQDAAQRFGMTYPTASQYVRAGDTLAMKDSGTADTSAGDDTAEPEGA